MTWIDSNVILDLVTADERWMEWSAGRWVEAADARPGWADTPGDEPKACRAGEGG